MNVLNREGDWKLEWDPKNSLEVEQMRKTFDHNVKDKGFAAYRIDARGKQKDQIFSFDPTAERIVLIPPMVGG
jgi:hypothetical protein